MDELNAFRLFLLTEQKGKKRVRGKRTVDLHIQLLTRLKKAVPNLEPEKILSYLYSLYDEGRKGTYLNDYIDTLHVYGRFKDTTIFDTLKYFPEEDFEAARMSDEEIEAFLALPPPSAKRYFARAKRVVTYVYSKGWEQKTMFWKLYAYHPARPGEIAHLTIDDIDFGLGVLRVDGKTGKRQIAIHPAVRSDLEKYVATINSHYLFPSARGGMSRGGEPVISDVDWGYDFHKRIKRIQLKRKNIRPYSLRHSSITRLLDNGVNVFLVGRMAGQKRVETTMKYYHESLKAQREAMDNDPLGRKLLEYQERFKRFRADVRKSLAKHTLNITEEKQMLQDLLQTL